MPVKRLVVVVAGAGVLLAGLLGGCRRESVAEREEFAGVMTSPGGRGLIPITLPQRKGESILGAAAAPGEQPREQRGEVAEQPPLDVSSPEAVGQALAQIASANEWTRLPDLLVDDQADAVRDLIDELALFATAVGEFNRAADERFETHAVVIEMREAWLEQLAALAGELRVEVGSVGGDEVPVMFVSGHPDALQPRRVELVARRSDEGWRLMFPNFRAPVDPAALELDRKAEAFRDLVNRIRNDEVRNAIEAEAEAEKVIAGTYEMVGGAAPDQAGPDEEAAPQPAPNQRRAYDPVDSTYTGPGMLRQR